MIFDTQRKHEPAKSFQKSFIIIINAIWISYLSTGYKRNIWTVKIVESMNV